MNSIDQEIIANNQIEKQTALIGPESAVKGFEYLIHWEKQRLRDEVFTNEFIHHISMQNK